jgi:hypothetical protein
MSWRLAGTYFESCSCDAVCPCTWSGLSAPATLDRCRALLAYHVVEVADFVAIPDRGPVQLANVAHPSNTTLTVAPARKAALSTFGIEWGHAGQSGFSAPFSWLG